MVAVDCKVTTESASNHEQIPKYSFKCTCQDVCPHGFLQQAATASSTASVAPGRLALNVAHRLKDTLEACAATLDGHHGADAALAMTPLLGEPTVDAAWAHSKPLK